MEMKIKIDKNLLDKSVKEYILKLERENESLKLKNNELKQKYRKYKVDYDFFMTYKNKLKESTKNLIDQLEDANLYEPKYEYGL